MKMKMRRGVALILVLLFTATALLVVISISVQLITGIKMNRQSQRMSQAYNFARGGLDVEVAKLRANITDPDPANVSCTSTYDTILLTNNIYVSGTTSNLQRWPITNGSNIKLHGAYAARMCGDAIISIGFYGGQKVTLEGKINDPATFSTDANMITTYDHSQATIKIYQTGS